MLIPQSQFQGFQGVLAFVKAKSVELVEEGLVHQPLLFALVGEQLNICLLSEGPPREIIPELLRQLQPSGYVFVAESWAGEINPDDYSLYMDDEGNMKRHIKDWPGSFEIVTVVAVAYKGDNGEIWSAKINKRGPGGVAKWELIPRNGGTSAILTNDW